MCRVILSLLITLMSGAVAHAQGVDDARFHGIWNGVLETGGPSLRLELRVDTDTVTLVSVDQGGAQIPAEAASVDADTLIASFPSAGASINLQLTNADMLEGSFTQGGGTLSLNMARGATPEEVEVEIIGSDEEIIVQTPIVRLAGSVRRPDGDGPFPAILLLNGSGSQDRNATVMGQPVFGVLADALAARGIASLRLDDRGLGGSQMVPPTSPLDLADDAVHALAALRDADQVNASCVAILGHSEGGLIAFLAADATEPDFIITLAGMHGTMADTLYEQSEAIIMASGGRQAGADANRVLQTAMFDVMRTAPQAEVADAMIAALTERGFPEEAARQQAAIWAQPYAVVALDLDPATAMAGYHGPVHAFFGSRDLQVLAQPNSERLLAARDGLPTEITVIEGVNHLFQDAQTGLPAEYASAPHAMSPQSLAAIADAAEALIGEVCL